jgi:prepilin-type N-terminal cleavage/methylation domain-containing protein
MALHRHRGFTLIELMVVVAVMAVILMTVAPGFRDTIVKRRIMGTADQFMTDVQFARTEAASRQTTTRLRFKTVSSGMTCYIVHVCSPTATAVCECDCSAAAGSRCADNAHELRTVQLDSAESVALFPVRNDGNTAITADIAFDPATGGVSTYFPVVLFGPQPPAGGELWVKVSKVGTTSGPSIRVMVNTIGRPRSCAQGGGQYSGMGACP